MTRRRPSACPRAVAPVVPEHLADRRAATAPCRSSRRSRSVALHRRARPSYTADRRRSPAPNSPRRNPRTATPAADRPRAIPSADRSPWRRRPDSAPATAATPRGQFPRVLNPRGSPKQRRHSASSAKAAWRRKLQAGRAGGRPGKGHRLDPSMLPKECGHQQRPPSRRPLPRSCRRHLQLRHIPLPRSGHRLTSSEVV